MPTLSMHPSLEPLSECVQSWTTEHSRIALEVAESLEALEGFQRQLDQWQAQLAEQREQLAAERQALAESQAEWTAERGTADEVDKQLVAAQAESDTLREQLAGEAQRADELQEQLAQNQSDLDRATRREAELTQALDRQRAERAEEQARWDEDFRRMRELLQHQVDTSPPAETPPADPLREPEAVAVADPVLDSVLAQFGKLREQQAGRRAGVTKNED